MAATLPPDREPWGAGNGPSRRGCSQPIAATAACCTTLSHSAKSFVERLQGPATEVQCNWPYWSACSICNEYLQLRQQSAISNAPMLVGISCERKNCPDTKCHRYSKVGSSSYYYCVAALGAELAIAQFGHANGTAFWIGLACVRAQNQHVSDGPTK